RDPKRRPVDARLDLHVAAALAPGQADPGDAVGSYLARQSWRSPPEQLVEDWCGQFEGELDRCGDQDRGHRRPHVHVF
ncbi:MAG: hypothetical protein QOF25_2504, partial [Mycobacterium sp.]|nr:hypothetical protein [Mycobacterium sp.]